MKKFMIFISIIIFSILLSLSIDSLVCKEVHGIWSWEVFPAPVINDSTGCYIKVNDSLTIREKKDKYGTDKAYVYVNNKKTNENTLMWMHKDKQGLLRYLVGHYYKNNTTKPEIKYYKIKCD